jgi:plastocyanin
MYKKVLFGLLAFALISVLAVACSIKEQASESKYQVKMGASDFIDKTITIPKGENVTFVNEVASVHVITNGTWKGSTADTTVEAGAVKTNFNVANKEQKYTIGPFTTAGSFKYYCTVHPGMNLTITVQ